MNLRPHFSARVIAAFLASAILLLGASGCSPAPVASNYQAATPAEIQIPATPAGELATWVITQINAQSPIDAAELNAHMDPELLKGITAGDLANVLGERQTSRVWVPTKVQESAVDDMTVIYVRLQSDSSDAVSVLQVSQSRKSKLMVGIYFLAPGAVDFSASS